MEGDAEGAREREIKTKIFTHTSAQEPSGFGFVTCPMLLLDRPGLVLMEIPGQQGNDHQTEPRGVRAILGEVHAEWPGL